MSWIYLVFAGLLEVVWAYFMKQSVGFTRLVPSLITGVALVASFSLLALAMRTLPLGTAYTIWTGIGAIGAFIVGIIWFQEPVTTARLVAALLIIAGLLFMKFASV
ncbi:DMT family transporter [Spirosoma litoris]